MNSFVLISTLFALLCAATGTEVKGVVSGWTDCGSVGTVSQVGLDDCTNVPCNLVVGRDYETIVDFVSSTRIAMINLRVNVITAQGSINLYDVSVQGDIRPDVPNSLSLALPVTNRFEGQTIQLEFELANYESGERELCVGILATVARS